MSARLSTRLYVRPPVCLSRLPTAAAAWAGLLLSAGARAYQQMRVASCREPRDEVQRRLVGSECIRYMLMFYAFRVLQIRFAIQGWLGSRVVSVLDSGAEGPGFKSQSRCCRVTVLGKLFTPIVPLFTKQRNC